MRRWLHWCRLADHPGDALAKPPAGFDLRGACREELGVIVDQRRSLLDGRIAA